MYWSSNVMMTSGRPLLIILWLPVYLKVCCDTFRVECWRDIIQFTFWLCHLSFSCLIFSWKGKGTARMPFKQACIFRVRKLFSPFMRIEESPCPQVMWFQPLQLILFGIPSTTFWYVLMKYILAFKIFRVLRVIVMPSVMPFGNCIWSPRMFTGASFCWHTIGFLHFSPFVLPCCSGWELFNTQRDKYYYLHCIFLKLDIEEKKKG